MMARTPPTVSVLMTVYNTERYLRASIESILGQTLEDFELIIVDDCSDDGSWTVIEEFVSRDARVIAFRRDARGGASSGLNKALQLASGGFLTRQDSDDISLPTRLAEQVAFFEANPDVGGLGTTAVIIGSEGEVHGEFRVPERNAEIQIAVQEYMCFVGPTVMARRTSFDAIGLHFDETLSSSEDYDLCLRLAEVTKMANLQRPLYLYRHHSDSVSHRQRHRQIFRKALALEKAAARRFGPAPPPGQLANAARDYLRAAVLGHAAERSTANRECASRAAALDPSLFDNTDVVDQIVQTCTPPMPEGEAAQFVESLFDEVLPRTRRMASLERRLVADFHIREALLPANRGDVRKIGQHLWPALRRNPRWLANRGVLSLLINQAVSLARRPGSLDERSSLGRSDRA